MAILVIGFLRVGCPRGGGNWGYPEDSSREDWGTLGKIRGITTRDPGQNPIIHRGEVPAPCYQQAAILSCLGYGITLQSPKFSKNSQQSKVVSTHRTGTHPKQPLPTGYKGIPFIIGYGDCLGCALGVCCNFLGNKKWEFSLNTLASAGLA